MRKAKIIYSLDRLLDRAPWYLLAVYGGAALFKLSLKNPGLIVIPVLILCFGLAYTLAAKAKPKVRRKRVTNLRELPYGGHYKKSA